jgi:hypothetical protein
MGYSKSKLTPAIWGGLFITIISVVPGLSFINCLCCSGVAGGGVLAVYLHQRSTHSKLTARVGAELGVLTGLTGTVFSALVIILVYPYTMALQSEITSYINNPDIEAFLQNIEPELIQRSFIAIAISVSFLINMLFALIGGLIGVALFGKGRIPHTENDKGDDDAIVVEKIDF